ncbi:hypothetical protein D9M69_535830 [compost metagenome]
MRITVPTDTPPMAQPTNCVVPTGGVFRPSAQLMSITTPNCTEVMPYCCAMGRKIGVHSRMVAAMSRKVPSTNRMMLMSRKIIHGVVVTCDSIWPVSSATPYRLMR